MISAVTGAFGFTGKYIARRLMARGERVLTFTSKTPQTSVPDVVVHPYRFDRPDQMAKALEGVRVLYNTYWVRFDHGQATHGLAVENTRALLRAARMAGVERVVHVSITNPDAGSPLPYFRGKALLEEAVRDSGLSYAILRPALLFGPEDILINNIAYLLRRMPVFVIPGGGRYRLQPIYVDDLAELAVAESTCTDNHVIDAIGPETFAFEDLVRLIKRVTGSRAVMWHAPPRLALWAVRALGPVLGDVILTKEEIDGLMANLLVTASAPVGKTRLSDWLQENADTTGAAYASELRRHYAIPRRNR